VALYEVPVKPIAHAQRSFEVYATAGRFFSEGGFAKGFGDNVESQNGSFNIGDGEAYAADGNARAERTVIGKLTDFDAQGTSAGDGPAADDDTRSLDDSCKHGTSSPSPPAS
jgi:hypothetical protein